VEVFYLDTNINILNQGIKLFRERGYNLVSIDDICEAAGITKSTFYYHYKSKNDLIAQFFNDTHILVKEKLLDLLSHEQPLEQLWLLLSMYLQNLADAGPGLARQVYITSLERRVRTILPSDIHLRETILLLLRKLKPELTEPQIVLLYDTMIYTLDGIGLTWSLSDGEFDFLTACRKSYDLLLCGV